LLSTERGRYPSIGTNRTGDRLVTIQQAAIGDVLKGYVLDSIGASDRPVR